MKLSNTFSSLFKRFRTEPRREKQLQPDGGKTQGRADAPVPARADELIPAVVAPACADAPIAAGGAPASANAPVPAGGAPVSADAPVPASANAFAPVAPAPAERVAFTRRAWTAIFSEVLKEVSTETGGILLGYRTGSEWVVVESIDPGPDSVFQVAYFEYDQPYVTHAATRVCNYYARPLEILGLWHRHPGSMDRFSRTDDGTNLSFASMSPAGAISGLVNIDPACRMTLYGVTVGGLSGVKYARIPFTVLDARESERIAPLRDIGALVASIEERVAAVREGWPGASHAPAITREGLASLTKRAGEAVARGRDAGGAWAPSPGSLAKWSEERIAGALQVLEADIAAFGEMGVELRMRLLDERHIGLSAHFGEWEEPLCVLVCASPAPAGEPATCVYDAREPAVAIPYAPGFFKQYLAAGQGVSAVDIPRR